HRNVWRSPSFSYDTSLLLRNVNKDQLFDAWADDSFTEGWNNKERALARYMPNVLIKELANCYFEVDTKKVTLKTDFSIWKGNPFVIVDEDNHLNNISKNTWWGECQIAGELLALAFVNYNVLQRNTVLNHSLQYV
ncbi:24982_t:CDS:2, partial [Dentiscutata erythropus]